MIKYISINKDPELAFAIFECERSFVEKKANHM